MGIEFSQALRMTNGLGFTDSSVEEPVAAFTAVIERAKAGDPVAFEQIMVQHQQRVISTAWRMLGNREDARDAAQEVFLRVHKYLKSFRTNDNFSAWVYRIVVNVCRDQARKRGRREQFASFEAELEFGKLETLLAVDDVEASAIRSQQQAFVANALATLSNKEREALVLRDLEGLSTEEVARILGSTQATVRSQISTARAKIKRCHDRLIKRRRGEL